MPAQKLEFHRKQGQSCLRAVRNSLVLVVFYLLFDHHRQYTLG